MDVIPEKQNVDKLFGTQVYEIDFYQRQYKWGKEPVQELLRDIFYKFNEEYKKHGDWDGEIEKKISEYAWYYLNTYVISTLAHQTYVVDGQQRLTTLTLILIKLYWLSGKIVPDLQNWISQKICGQHGFSHKFWMNHEDSLQTLDAIFKHGTEAQVVENTVTAQNLVTNYKIVSEWLDKELPLTDGKRFSAFVFYFMERLVLVQLDVTNNSDVPMVFEVINDRGLKLRPYEILKGQLLGQIDKNELKALELNAAWERQIGCLNAMKENEADSFFTTYLRAKFVGKLQEWQSCEGDYHRVMMSQENLALSHNPGKVKKFLREDFIYFTNLYLKLTKARESEDARFPAVFYNTLTRMDNQMALILSACRVDDPEEDSKIKVVSEELDRMFCILQLQGAYRSHDFLQEIIEVMTLIREKPVADIPAVFDQMILNIIARNKDERALTTLWTYAHFKNLGYEMNRQFLRYVFARLDQFIAIGEKVSMRHSFSDLVYKKYSNGFHIEHILALNEQNLHLFPDEETFRSQRNRLGALLLMKGADNESSGKEQYADKLKTYVGTLLWNETLVEATYAHKLDLRKWIQENGFNLRPLPSFGQDEIEERHQLLFRMLGQIWNAKRCLARSAMLENGEEE